MRAPIGMSSPRDAARIAAAVPALVVTADDRHDRIREVDQRQDVGADVDVQLHLLELGRVSLPGLLRMCSGTASLPVSCSSAAASIAFSVGSSTTPSARARPIA